MASHGGSLFCSWTCPEQGSHTVGVDGSLFKKEQGGHTFSLEPHRTARPAGRAPLLGAPSSTSPCDAFTRHVRQMSGHDVSSCCRVALSTSPTSPAPPRRSIAHIFDMENGARGTQCLTWTMRTIRSLLQPARTKPGRPGKSAMLAGPLQRSARAWSPRSWQHRPKV